MEKYVITLQQRLSLGGDYFAFVFDKPEELSFKDGQYGVFLHNDKEIEGRKMRAFSFASSFKEDQLVVGTKIIQEPSDFKQKMMELHIGETMSVAGPMGNFLYDESKPAVFIAGGIGITPIRGIIRGGLHKKSVLIFSERSEIYPFKGDMEITTKYVSGVEETVGTIEVTHEQFHNDAIYYIAGSPSFIESITNLITDLGVDKTNIIFDRFTGY